jgi:putative intracellular protease/amidase
MHRGGGNTSAGRVLRDQVARFWALGRPAGAICHGVLVLARTRDVATGRSILASRRTTCLPKYVERFAYLATAWRLGRYYRSYRACVEDEVNAALDDPGQPVPARAGHPHHARHRGRRHASLRRGRPHLPVRAPAR